MNSATRRDEVLIAPCGFYCGICPLFAQRRCKGCKQIQTHCQMYECSQARGLVCCEQCAEFPCDRMRQEDVFVLSTEWLNWMNETMTSDTGAIE